jgi:hypothetical protein
VRISITHSAPFAVLAIGDLPLAVHTFYSDGWALRESLLLLLGGRCPGLRRHESRRPLGMGSIPRFVVITNLALPAIASRRFDRTTCRPMAPPQGPG